MDKIIFLPSRIHQQDEAGVIVDDGLSNHYLPLVLSHEEVLAAQRLVISTSPAEATIIAAAPQEPPASARKTSGATTAA